MDAIKHSETPRILYHYKSSPNTGGSNTIITTHFISSNAIYTSDNSGFSKNGTLLTNEDGTLINNATFNLLIKKETSSFIHKTFNNIIVLASAGASVFCTSGKIDPRFSKTVFILAELINDALKQDPNLFTLQELANLCKYNTPVEIKGKNAVSTLNPSFNLEEFLSDLLSFEKYVSNTDLAKYDSSKDKIFKLIVSNTNYNYDNNFLKHAAFINTVSHLVRTPHYFALTINLLQNIFIHVTKCSRKQKNDTPMLQ